MEFCIMPESILYWNRRELNMHRHEIFYGKGIREKSIKYGLIVFLPPELHNMSDLGVHFNKDFDLLLKRAGQRAAMEYYNWTIEDFIKEFGKSYI